MTIETIAVLSANTTELEVPIPKPTALTPDLTEAAKRLWGADKVEVGIWECSPGSFTAVRNGYSEICQLLSGSVLVETEGGDSTELAAGDTLVMPSGWRGTWHVRTKLRKVYVIVTD